MKMATLVTALALLLLPACGPESEGGLPLAQVDLVYVPTTGHSCSDPAVVDCYGFCLHDSAPADHRVVTNWREETRLERCGDAYCATLRQVPVGQEVGV